VTVSIRRMSLGSGYRYLMDSVARGDGAGHASSPLTRYYAESGTPPGRFLGAGLVGLDGGIGVVEGAEVTEPMLFNMLGMVADPITGQPLGRRPRHWPKPLQDRIRDRIAALPSGLNDPDRVGEVARIEEEEQEREKRLIRPVAGFDLTFSVPKSVSAAWAVSDASTQAVIYQTHQDAIRIAIRYAERNVFFSRSGTNGVVQEEIRGVVAAAFDHWDSRAGDPHLHTHVAVINRAQSLDGAWRTLDSRTLFKHVVALSELHEGVLSDLLTERLGWGWDERARQHSPVPRHDVTGVPDLLIAEFSQRSQQLEIAKSAHISAFVSQHGRQPTAAEVLRMRQRATLETRPDKDHRSLRAQTADWRERARPYVGDDTVAWVKTLRGRNKLPLLRSTDLADPILRDAAAVALMKVSERRATFTRANVLAEVHRELHGVRFASPDDRIQVADRTTDLALGEALLVTPPELHHVPVAFRRADGTSKFRFRGAAIYTTEALLNAEARLLEAGRNISGPAAAVEGVGTDDLPGKDHGLSVDQSAVVEAVATSGRVLDVLVGPAGTGKTASLAGLRVTWEQRYGPGSVIGLAPSAAAAEVLADELGIDTENTAKWLTEGRRQSERVGQIEAGLERLRASSNRSSVLARRIAARIRVLESECHRWSLHPGQLVIIDEASLAGTFALAAIVAQADQAGAKVLLVGDWAQLSSIEAGGAFAMLARDRENVPELTNVRRFANAWERKASTHLRVGDEAAINAYTQHGRVKSGDRADMTDALYNAWRDDVGRGHSSLMIAGDLETVAELNLRARADRVRAGEVTEAGIKVAGGGSAGVGDRLVTRENNRRLSTGHRWVKNGDTWVVRGVGDDGSMRVRRENGRGEVTLPAAYVRHHVELGYAATAYRAQGRTVDTAHTIIGATTTREVLYVAATRGREANTIYVDTSNESDVDTSHGPTEERSAHVVLRAVLDNLGADVSAHTTIERELNKAESVEHVAAEYQTIKSRASAGRDRDLDWGLAERASLLRRAPAIKPWSDQALSIRSTSVTESHDI
jgi:conjugative relaxase-like TrwC/TraI family protein